MRGEYRLGLLQSFPNKELPPRARRILAIVSSALPITGTTSACAENTALLIVAVVLTGNYLRVRGEYKDQPQGLVPYRELPPRARRIQAGALDQG